MSQRSRRFRPTTPLLSLLAALAPASVMAAQIEIPEELPVDPELPVKAGFDVDRAFLGSRPIFTPLRDARFEPLDGVLDRGDLTRDTPLLVFRTAGRTLSLVSSQMAYHHVAQGEMAGEPWMVTF